MNLILVCANFQKMYLVSLLLLHTNLFNRQIYFLAKYNASILGWTNKMIQQYPYIIRFMYILAFAHPYKDRNYATTGEELTP